MTNLYYVRYPKPDFSIRDDLLRPLTEEGKRDSKLVTDFLLKKDIAKIYSSPYVRAISTIEDFADLSGLKIEIINDFREKNIR